MAEMYFLFRILFRSDARKKRFVKAKLIVFGVGAKLIATSSGSSRLVTR